MNRPPFRIIFMGTPDFATASLSSLIQGPDHVVAVITQPDRPRGRSSKLLAPPVKVLAEDQGIPVHQPTKIRTAVFTDLLKGYSPDIIVVAAYGRILPPAVLSLPKYGCINVHGSLLPRHRGAAPIQWSLIKGDPEVGVTIMQMDEGMDTGDMLMKAAITPLPDETAGSLFPKIAQLGSQTLMDCIDLLGQGGLAIIQQNHDLATSAPMLKKDDGLITWRRPAEDICNLIRGLDPWPTAFCYIDGKKTQLFSPEVVHRNSTKIPGTLIRADREGLLVSTSRACLLIKEIKMEGKKRMAVGDFLNGYPIKLGINLSARKV